MVIPVIATWEAQGSGPLEAQKPVRISCPMKAQARDPASNKHWKAPEEWTPKEVAL